MCLGRRGALSGVLALSAVLSWGDTGPVQAAVAEAPSGRGHAVRESRQPPAAARETPPAVNWHACAPGWKVGRGWRCGTLETPLDHGDPRKGTLKLAVAKLPATEPSQRIGSLLTNPGGPGGSGIDMAKAGGWPTYVTKDVRKRFDLVTYDPRGVGRSSPRLNCAQPTPRPRGAQDDGSEHQSPRTVPEMTDQLKEKDGTGAACVKNAGWLVPYMSTADNVHDLDRLRRAVGDAKLSYLGISYGTTIGAVYANMFPQKVRSLVLHSVVDAGTQAADPDAYSLTEAVGGEATARAVLRACDRDPQHCAFHGDAPEKFDRLARRLGDAHPPRPAPFETWNRFVDMAYKVKDPDSAGDAAKDLQKLYEQTFPPGSSGSSGSSRSSRRPKSSRPSGTSASSRASGATPVRTGAAEPEQRNEDDVLDTTDCLDVPPPPKEQGPWLARFARARSEAPIAGPADIVADIACRDWPDDHRAALPRYTGPWNRLKSPVLVMNHQWDWGTPLTWARNMTRALGQRGMVAVKGFGHGDPTDCTRRRVEDYLLHGKVPAGFEVCDDGDTTPFSAD